MSGPLAAKFQGAYVNLSCWSVLNLDFNELLIIRYIVNLITALSKKLPNYKYTLIIWYVLISETGKWVLKIQFSPPTFFFLWLHPQHRKVLGPGIEPRPQQQPKLPQRQCWILKPLSHSGNSHLQLFIRLSSIIFFYISPKNSYKIF